MTAQGDVDLTTSTGKQTSVLALLEECRARWPSGEDARKRAEAMERFTYGRLIGKGSLLEASVMARVSMAPPVSKNKIKNFVLTWASRISRARTNAMAYANESSPEDLAAAEVANAVLDYQRQLQDRDAMLARASVQVAMHGTVGFYCTWDPDKGPYRERVPVLDAFGIPQRDEAGAYLYTQQDGTGAPHIEVLTIHDFITSGERDSTEGKWCLIRRWLDPDEANAALRLSAEAAGQKAPEASVQTVSSRMGSGKDREAVEGWELWWRPNPMGRFPDGLFATVIGGYVTSAQPFPYAHKKLPLAVWRVMDVEDDFYGATWVEDAIPMQIGLNHSLRVAAYRAEVAGQVRTLALSSVAQKWGDAPDGMIECDSMDEIASGVRTVETPEIPRDVYELADRYEQGIADVAGVSDVASRGDAAAETKNARLVAYSTEVDEQKAEHTVRNLDECMVKVDQQVLELWQQYVSNQRLVRIIGEDNAVSASFFKGAEIKGVDVRLEAGPAIQRMRAAKGKDADDRMQMGTLDPGVGSELSRTGLDSTVADADARSRIAGLIQQALVGQPVQADPGIDPKIAVAELRGALQSLSSQGPRVTMPLRALLQEYADLSQQSTQEAQGPAGMPSPQKPKAGGTPGPAPGETRLFQ